MQMTALFEHANEGIIITDGKGRIVMINPSAEKLFLYESAELSGKTIDMLLPRRFRAAYEKYREKYFVNPAGPYLGYKGKLFAEDKTGEQMRVEVNLSYYQQDKEFYVAVFVKEASTRSSQVNCCTPKKPNHAVFLRACLI
jgi:PAS domain S-box-containing protein